MLSLTLDHIEYMPCLCHHQEPEYELVEVQQCIGFPRFNTIFHCNFVARPKNGSGGQNKLFFAEAMNKAKECRDGATRVYRTCSFCCILEEPIDSSMGPHSLLSVYCVAFHFSLYMYNIFNLVLQRHEDPVAAKAVIGIQVASNTLRTPMDSSHHMLTILTWLILPPKTLIMCALNCDVATHVII